MFGGHHVDEQLEPVDERRRECLHALDRVARQRSGRPCRAARGGPRPAAAPAPVPPASAASPGRGTPRRGHGSRRRTAGRRPGRRGSPRWCRRRSRCGPGAPRSAGTGPRCRRARELAAVLDEVDADVRGVDQVARELVRVVVLTGRQRDRPHLAEPFDLGLEQRPYWRDDDLRARQLTVPGEATQHRQSPADRVRSRAQPLVGQCLPGRVVRHVVGPEHRGDLGGQLLGLAVGAGDQQDRCGRCPRRTLRPAADAARRAPSRPERPAPSARPPRHDPPRGPPPQRQSGPSPSRPTTLPALYDSPGPHSGLLSRRIRVSVPPMEPTPRRGPQGHD